MKTIKKWMIYFIALFGLSAFDALAIKADIGVAPLEALQISFSEISSIKVGTIAIILNFAFIFLQIFILRKNFKPSQYLQFIVSFVSGFMINFWLYDVYSFEVSAYWVRILLILTSFVGSSFFLGVIISLDLVTMPLEALCMVISEVKKIKFPKLRQLADVINTVASLILSLIFHVGISVREGSVLAMFIYAPLLGYFMKLETPVLKKIDVLSEEIASVES